MTNAKKWNIKASDASMRTPNPIRSAVVKMSALSNPEKEMISLSIGDPTIFGNLNIDKISKEAIKNAVESEKFNGYASSDGYIKSREVIAKKYSCSNSNLTAKDVLLANGASGALEIAITALCESGTNILLPTPGFPLYEVIASNRDINIKFYNLIPERGWEIDLSHLESLIDEKTSAVIINNPSNPCGSNFTKNHLEDLLKLLSEKRIPLITDEIYADMVWGMEFIPAASIPSDVPILTIGGTAKRWLVPGWRMGWVLIHDRNNVFDELRKGLFNMTCILVGPNTLVQAALPEILEHTPKSFYSDTISTLEKHAKLTIDCISTIPGLKVVIPQGAMYVMVEINISKFKDIKDDMEFAEKFISEESVFVLPGTCFRYPNYFRIVTTPPPEKLLIAYQRLREFCLRHQI